MGTTARTADTAPPSGLEELYVVHAPAALRFAYYLSGDGEHAKDLVQDAFVRVAGRFAHIRRPDVFDTYLRRTIFNLHTSRLRRLRLERAYLAREAPRAEPSRTDADPAERDEIWSVILELPARQRAAIVLRFYEDPSMVWPNTRVRWSRSSGVSASGSDSGASRGDQYHLAMSTKSKTMPAISNAKI
jgi:RNA polymerase sigma factor (sigma-70 family)